MENYDVKERSNNCGLDEEVDHFGDGGEDVGFAVVDMSSLSTEELQLCLDDYNEEKLWSSYFSGVCEKSVESTYVCEGKLGELRSSWEDYVGSVTVGMCLNVDTDYVFGNVVSANSDPDVEDAVGLRIIEELFGFRGKGSFDEVLTLITGVPCTSAVLLSGGGGYYSVKWESLLLLCTVCHWGGVCKYVCLLDSIRDLIRDAWRVVSYDMRKRMICEWFCSTIGGMKEYYYLKQYGSRLVNKFMSVCAKFVPVVDMSMYWMCCTSVSNIGVDSTMSYSNVRKIFICVCVALAIKRRMSVEEFGVLWNVMGEKTVQISSEHWFITNKYNIMLFEVLGEMVFKNSFRIIDQLLCCGRPKVWSVTAKRECYGMVGGVPTVNGKAMDCYNYVPWLVDGFTKYNTGVMLQFRMRVMGQAVGTFHVSSNVKAFETGVQLLRSMSKKKILYLFQALGVIVVNDNTIYDRTAHTYVVFGGVCAHISMLGWIVLAYYDSLRDVVRYLMKWCQQGSTLYCLAMRAYVIGGCDLFVAISFLSTCLTVYYEDDIEKWKEICGTYD